MSDNLAKRLSLLADSIELGDKLRWGEDSAALRDAKDRIEELEAQIAAMEEGLTAVHMAGYMDGKKATEDDLVQAAVAASLREAAGIASYHQDWGDAQSAILALITPDAQAALDRAKAAEQERCAKIAWSHVDDEISGDPDFDAGWEAAACAITDAIRKGGE